MEQFGPDRQIVTSIIGKVLFYVIDQNRKISTAQEGYIKEESLVRVFL